MNLEAPPAHPQLPVEHVLAGQDAGVRPADAGRESLLQGNAGFKPPEAEVHGRPGLRVGILVPLHLMAAHDVVDAGYSRQVNSAIGRVTSSDLEGGDEPNRALARDLDIVDETLEKVFDLTHDDPTNTSLLVRTIADNGWVGPVNRTLTDEEHQLAADSLWTRLDEGELGDFTASLWRRFRHREVLRRYGSFEESAQTMGLSAVGDGTLEAGDIDSIAEERAKQACFTFLRRVVCDMAGYPETSLSYMEKGELPAEAAEIDLTESTPDTGEIVSGITSRDKGDREIFTALRQAFDSNGNENSLKFIEWVRRHGAEWLGPMDREPETEDRHRLIDEMWSRCDIPCGGDNLQELLADAVERHYGFNYEGQERPDLIREEASLRAQDNTFAFLRTVAVEHSRSETRQEPE